MRAIAEVTFVNRRQQGVEDRRTRFPYFIEKDDFGFRQVAGG